MSEPPSLPPPGFQPPPSPTPGPGGFGPPGIGQPPTSGAPAFVPPTQAGGGFGGGPGGPPGMVPVQSEPPKPSWWKSPLAIGVAVAAVVAIIVGVVLATTGGDDETTKTTDPTEVTDSAPDRTDSDTTRPRRTTTTTDDTDETTEDTSDGTDPPFSLPPLTDPPGTATSTTAGRGTPTTTGRSPGAVAIGVGVKTTVDDQDVQIIVLDMVDDAPAPEFSDPDPTDKYVAVRVLVSNESDRPYDMFGGISSKLIDDTGQQFSPGFVNAAVGPSLSGFTVPAADVRSGWVTFEVPQTSAPQRFQWDLGSDFAEWDLTAPRQDPGALPQPGAPVVAFGTAAQLIGTDDEPFELTVNQTVDNSQPSFGTLDDGTRLFAVQVTYDNTGTASMDEFPEANLIVVDTIGQEYRASFLGTDAGPGFDGDVKLSPNDSRTGFLAFELPVDATVLKIAGDYRTPAGDVMSMAVA